MILMVIDYYQPLKISLEKYSFFSILFHFETEIDKNFHLRVFTTFHVDTRGTATPPMKNIILS